MASKAVKAPTAKERERIDEKRKATLESTFSDPYIGFKDFDEAFAAARFTSQPEVFARLLNRENLFISGLAGAGKTTVLNRFISLIDALYGGEFNVAVTASTGIAATLVGGTTIHSWAGLGISTEPFSPQRIEPAMWGKKKAIRETDVLIIDEISMLPAHLFTKLDKLMRHMRRNSEPFGGVQLIVTGDFLQLPPVSKRGEEHVDTRFAIETDSWKEADFNYCFMDKSYRATDERLKQLLLEISGGNVSPDMRGLIASRMDPEVKDPERTYTQLFTTNRNVDKFNEERLAENPNRATTYAHRASGDADKVEKLIKQHNIPRNLELKIGATVICTKNLTTEGGELQASNGSLGVVERCTPDSVIVKFNNGKRVVIERTEVASHTEEITYTNPLTKQPVKYSAKTVLIMQIPLKLGYAITVHKSQGQTFDGVVVDLRQAFQEGLGYVALSRVRTLDDLVLTGISEMAYQVSKKSQRISLYVKKSSYRERTRFIKNREYYEGIITNKDNCLDKLWDVNNSAARQNRTPGRIERGFTRIALVE